MPISPSLGLIEWVRKTQTLKKFLETISRDVFKSPDLLEDAKQLKWKEVTDRRKRNYDEERLATMPVDKVRTEKSLLTLLQAPHIHLVS